MLCPVLSRLSLVAVLGLTVSPVSAQEMYPGQTSAPLGWVQFDNGATGAIVSDDGNALGIQYHNGSTTETSYLSKTGGGWGSTAAAAPSGTGNGIQVDIGKLWDWAKDPANFGRAAAGSAALALQVALTPSEIADGTTCAGIGGASGDICNAYGFAACTAVLGNGRIFMDQTPCFAGNSLLKNGFQYLWHPGVTSSTSSQVYPPEQYPDRVVGTETTMFRNIFDSLDALIAALGSADGQFFACLVNDNIPSCPEDVTKNPAQEDAIGDLVGAPGWTEGDHPTKQPGAPAPWIGQGIPLPPGVAPGTAPEVMNPGGLAEPADITTTPALVPGIQAGTGTTTGTGTGSGTASGSTVTVEFPDTMDVTILNQPTVTPPPTSWALPAIPEIDLDLPSLSPGAKWLPSSCPEPLAIEVAGKSISIPWTTACTIMQLLGNLIVAVGAMQCGMLVFRGE